ncbi:hypothetical protein MUSASHINO07_10140 [Gemella sp. Musashino-2025]
MLKNPLKFPVLKRLTNIAATIKNGIVLKIENTALNILGNIFILNKIFVNNGRINKAVNSAKIDENTAMFKVSKIGS